MKKIIAIIILATASAYAEDKYDLDEDGKFVKVDNWTYHFGRQSQLTPEEILRSQGNSAKAQIIALRPGGLATANDPNWKPEQYKLTSR